MRELYALPKAMAALRAGQYFVHHRGTDGQLDVLAKSLRLRGYHVEAAEQGARANAATGGNSGVFPASETQWQSARRGSSVTFGGKRNGGAFVI